MKARRNTLAILSTLAALLVTTAGVALAQTAPAPAAAAPTASTAPSSATTPGTAAGAPSATGQPAKPHRRHWRRRHHVTAPGTKGAAAAPGTPAAGTPGAPETGNAPIAPVLEHPATPPSGHPAPAGVTAPAAPHLRAPMPETEIPPTPGLAAPAVVKPVIHPVPAKSSGLPAGLTPFGAIAAGNADGTIPAWTGGLNVPPPGYVIGGDHIDPYADEKPLYSITSANMAQYAPRLTPGIQAMLTQYPGYRLDIYPTHRSASAPPEILRALAQNARTAHMSPDGTQVLGAHLASPFPVPQNGLEAIWNHLLRFRGYQAHFTSYAATPTTSGDYTLIKNETSLLENYANGGSSDQGTLQSFLLKTLSPPLYAGQLAVAIDHVDPGHHPRDAWVYSPGESRVRRAPEVNFDTPNVQADSLITDDDLDLFNGSPERYDWTLVGRHEIYIPYNDYAFASQKRDYPDLLKPLFINPDYVRWELHRVWVVDAVLKPGKHHIYPHRTFYLDEDSWESVLGEEFDRRGQLWRVLSGSPVNFYEVPALTNGANIFYDLLARRYHVRGMRNRDSFLELTGPKMQPSEFTPDALREAGVR